MSTFSDELTAEVRTTVRLPWTHRDGLVVPENTAVGLGNDRVELDAVLLYADLADSTELAIRDQQIASEVFKSYLRGVTKIIKANGGDVRSFDGDRVMGVFIGDSKNSQAAKSGLQINWFFRYAVETEFRAYYGAAIGDVVFNQTVGIDQSRIFVARAGVRIENDLIWVGRAPNIAAKLSAVREPNYNTLITADVYGKLSDSSKFSPTDGTDMWTQLNWAAGNPYGIPKVYGSSWWVKA